MLWRLIQAGGSCGAPRRACAVRAPAGDSVHRHSPARTHARLPCTAAAKRSNLNSLVTRGRPLTNQQDSFSSGNAVEHLRRARRGPARVRARAGTEPAEPRGEPAHGQPARQPARLRAAARRPRQEVPEHDGVRSCAVLRARRRDRRPPRLQDQGAAGEDKHIHKDAGARRGAGVRGDGPQGGRGARQARDPVGGRALLADPRVAQVRRGAAAAGRRAGTRHGAGARAVPRRGARGGPQGRHHQAHPAHHAHVHRDAVPRARARVRGDGAAGERGGGAQGDRSAHRAAHGRGGRRGGSGGRGGGRAAGAAVPRGAGVAAAARPGAGLLVGGLVLVGRLVGAAGRPAGHLVVDGARRGAGRVAVVRVAGRRRGGRVGVGSAAFPRGVAGARVLRVRRARRGGGAGPVRPQPVLPGVRAAAGGGRRAVPRVLGARAPGHPHPVVSRPTRRRRILSSRTFL